MTRSSADPRPGGTVRRRILAYLADAVAVAGGIDALRRLCGRSGGPRWTLYVTALVAVPYHVVLEGATGRTVGKWLFGLVVTTADGGPCTYRAAAIRTAFRVVDWLPAGYLAGLVSMALTDRDRRLGDLAAGTIVVREEGPRVGSNPGHLAPA